MEIALVSSDSTSEQDQICWNPTVGSRLDAGLFNFHHQPVLVSSNKQHFEFHTKVLSLKSEMINIDLMSRYRQRRSPWTRFLIIES